MRERITITLAADLLPALDQLVDGSAIRNRSHAIEHAVRQGLALGELRHAFLSLSDQTPPELLENLLNQCARLQIRHIRLIAQNTQLSQASELAASLAQHQSSPQVEVIPGDFGDGGALLLRRSELDGPFLLANLAQLKTVPSNLVAAYVYHRQQQATLTHLIEEGGGDHFRLSGLSFADPSLLAAIPAGKVELALDVFPALLKAAKVSTYVTA